MPNKSFIQLLTNLRAWVFLIFLVATFEIWSHIAYDRTFIGNPYNLRSLAVFATVPLLLALGQTFVIISAGIDLSVGFIMGLAAVVSAQAVGYFGDLGLPATISALLGISVGCIVAILPGLINGCSSPPLASRHSSGLWECTASHAAQHFSLQAE